MLTLVILLVFSSKLVSSDTFKYSGLDSSRLKVRTQADQNNYFYTFNIGEHLNIRCEHYARRSITFKFHRTLVFSGLDPARLRTSSNGDQRYSFKPGELLTIGCETSGSEAKTFQFCNSLSRECNIIPSNLKFELQATAELNYSYLLCNIAGDHICLYLDNHEVSQTLPPQPLTPPQHPSAPVATQQPDTHTAGTAQATTTAVSSPVSRDENRRSDADKIWFTGFSRDLIVTATYPAATYYVYKYKNNEELHVNCNASPGDGTIIFSFTYVNYDPERMESFVYKATSATNGSTLLCVLQRNNSINVYSKRVMLLLDPAEQSTTTPTTVQTTTITSRKPRVINRNPERPTTTPATLQTTTVATTSSELLKNVVIAGACAVIVVLILVIIRYRRFMKQVNSNKMPENLMSRPPMDLPPEVEYEVVYSHGAGLQRPRRQQAQGAAPQHQGHVL